MLANRTCLTPLNMRNLTVFACSKTFNSNYAVETYSNHFLKSKAPAPILSSKKVFYSFNL